MSLKKQIGENQIKWKLMGLDWMDRRGLKLTGRTSLVLGSFYIIKKKPVYKARAGLDGVEVNRTGPE